MAYGRELCTLIRWEFQKYANGVPGEWKGYNPLILDYEENNQ